VADPLSSNIGLNLPLLGSNVGSWNIPVNADFSAMDGFMGGVLSLALSSSPVSLSVPSGFTAAPAAGPTQAQNAVIRFTGTLTANVTITLPMPGFYIVENLTTGNFLVTLRAVTATQVICIDQGMIQHVYNDGSNVRFVNFGATGQMELWGGRISMPAWVTNCTVPPYLICDGTVYNFSTYPYLGLRLGNQFGGNGITTFGVPDLRGRVPLAYDGTGTRITAAGSGINGQVMGAAADNQSVTLTASQIPTINSATGGPVIVRSQNGLTGIPVTSAAANVTQTTAGGGGSIAPASTAASWGGTDSLSTGTPVTSASTNTGGTLHTNVQPSQVSGIWVIRAA